MTLNAISFLLHKLFSKPISPFILLNSILNDINHRTNIEESVYLKSSATIKWEGLLF